VSPADLGVRVLVAEAVREAIQTSRSMNWLSRSCRRLLHWPAAASVTVHYAYPTKKIAPLIARLAATVDLSARDAALSASASDMQISFRHARKGRSLDQVKALALVLGALKTRAGAVRLPVSIVRPRASDEALGKTITVDLSTNRLRLYDGFRLVRTYPVATAVKPYSTPIGTWQVVAKELHPVWTNPGTAWAAGMPQRIAPGPANPLGLRALRLNASGILIHGTPEDSSVGHWASHGCVRMHEADIIALYPLVGVGTKVIVFGAPPWGASTVAGSSTGL
jgi:lipoprotein-anchoring transpeptidase ErfK/SrfK